MVLLRDDLFLVNERSKVGLGRGDPWPGVLCAAGILSYRDDFKVFVPQFFVEGLPAWQIKSATSPGGPGDEQNLLAAKISQRMQLAVQIRQAEVWRFERGEIAVLLGRTRPEIPDTIFLIHDDRLFN